MPTLTATPLAPALVVIAPASFDMGATDDDKFATSSSARVAA